MIVVVVHYYESSLMYEDNPWLQGLKYYGGLCYIFIFSDHILMNLCTCDKILHSLYLSYIVALVSIFKWKIIL